MQKSTYRNTFFIWTGTFRNGDGDPPGDSFSDSCTRIRAKAKSSSFIVIVFFYFGFDTFHQHTLQQQIKMLSPESELSKYHSLTRNVSFLSFVLAAIYLDDSQTHTMSVGIKGRN